MQLVKYQNDGLEFQINQETGLAYANAMAISRMLGVALQGRLQRTLELVTKESKVSAEIQTTTGEKTVTLYPANSDIIAILQEHAIV